MNIFVDIDNTICTTINSQEDKYMHSTPIVERIAEVNKLYDQGNSITYWTARGSESGNNYEELTKKSLFMSSFLTELHSKIKPENNIEL